MTDEKNLDISGKLRINPLAEVLAEIRQAKLDGSMRVSNGAHKSMIYFSEGNVVFAVSNSRAFRLFSILLNWKMIDKATLAKCPNFADDRQLAAELQRSGKFTKEKIDEFTVQQIEEILIDAMSWADGDWVFSPLTRLREDMRHSPNMVKSLRQYGRCLAVGYVAERFKSMHEMFSLSGQDVSGEFLADEGNVLKLFSGTSLTLRTILDDSSLPENNVLQALYVLWIGGDLTRMNWNSAFANSKIDAIKETKVSKVRGALTNIDHIVVMPEPEKPEENVEPKEVEITVEAYLDRVERSISHYEVLGIGIKADAPTIKNAYFVLARNFHPDRFHRSDTALLARVQKAFSKLAQAYETLKSPELRETYDFKMHKEFEALEKRRAAGLSDLPDSAEQSEVMADESFRSGFDLLSEDEYIAAIPYLARAVHLSPENAQYHAYYGQALTIDPKSKHKAEAEMQTAIKMEPENMEYRIMLIEFFLEMDLIKRAEGELVRMLAVKPDHKEAAELLNQIRETAVK